MKTTPKLLPEIRSIAAKDMLYNNLAPREFKEFVVLDKKMHIAFHFQVYRDQKTGRIYENLVGTLKEIGWNPPKKKESLIIKPQ